MEPKKPPFKLSLMISIGIHLLLVIIVVYWLREVPTPKPIHQDHKQIALSVSKFASIPIVHPQIYPNKIYPKPITQKSVANTFSSIQNLDNNTTNLVQIEDDKLLSSEEIAHLPRSIQHHYGDDFFALSAAQQHYLLTNLQKIRKINDIVGNRLLQSRPDEEIDTKENNIVEFYLHPDGSISGLSLSKEREDSLLDELTLETIELAHTQYPRPKQTTLIRIRVWIVVK
jgi:outer membrane biosynthesis protein TonB